MSLWDSLREWIRRPGTRGWHKSWWAKAVFCSSAFLFGSARKKLPYRRRLLLEVLEEKRDSFFPPRNGFFL